MSNTANPTRTEPRPGAWALLFERAFPARRIATILAALMLTVLLISFRPFQPAGAELEGAGGDIVNQLGFGTLGMLAIFSLLSFVDRRVLAALLSPWWLLLLGFLALSIVHAYAPAVALRSAGFTLIGILAMVAVLTLPRDAESFSTVLAFAGLTTVGLSYAGLVLLPDAATHGSGGFEPLHAGLWRGVFTHKNVAGPVMACLSFTGIYLWRRGRTRSGLLLFALALIFLANTGSRTTAGTVPLAILLVTLPGLIGARFLVPVLLTLMLVITGVATLGIVFIEPVKELANEIVPGLTYTQRTSLWAFMGEKIAERPWFGYGFESFWGGPVVQATDQHFDWTWDIRGTVHGHDGYLDLAVTMGLPALAVAIVTFALVPMRDYLRVPPLKENIYLADLFMMVVAFTLFNAFLESFFFRRADPVWMFLVLATLGLRLVARFPVATGPRR